MPIAQRGHMIKDLWCISGIPAELSREYQYLRISFMIVFTNFRFYVWYKQLEAEFMLTYDEIIIDSVLPGWKGT